LPQSYLRRHLLDKHQKVRLRGNRVDKARPRHCYPPLVGVGSPLAPARHARNYLARKARSLTTFERFPADRDGPRDECGVFGVYAPGHDVSRLAYFALYALQHRGQESAGIATCEGGHITT